MLGTLLEKLGALLPKNFIIANLFPMLLFAATNGLMLFWVSGRFRQLVREYVAMSAGQQALVGFPILIAITLAAYIFSTLNLFQREILEGKHLPNRVTAKLTAGQQRRTEDWENEFAVISEHRRRVLSLQGGETLLAARQKGNKLTTECKYSEESEAAKSIEALLRKRARYDFITAEELEQASSSLADELSKCPVDVASALGDEEAKKLLNDHHLALYKLLEFAKNEADNNYSACFNKREFNYSSYRLAPTAMGNIAESVRGYARSRYEMNLDPFWSRLQKILVSDEKFYSSLVDAKTQLDFLISLFWLTVCFTAVWTVGLLYLRRSIIAFLLVAVGGPLLSVLWYQIALQNYRVFADILRTSVDLYRFELLDTLHIRRPRGNEQERRTWDDLNQIIGYGNSDVRVSYHHPQQQP